jgi:hypothetical protein
MDWSRDGGRTWIQCGPFGNPENNASITAAAQVTNLGTSWVFRAATTTDGRSSPAGSEPENRKRRAWGLSALKSAD